MLAYDLAHAAAGVETARALLDYGAKGDLEARITCAFTADMLHDLSSQGRSAARTTGGSTRRSAGAGAPFVAPYRAPDFVASLADQPGPRHLDGDMEMVQDTFRSFADNVIAPHAEHVHRTNGDVPEEIIRGSPSWARSGSACPPSTAASARAATASTSRWSSPPRS